MLGKLAFLAFVSTVYSVQFQIINNSGSTPVYIQILGTELVDPFTLNGNEQVTLNFDEPWSGRVWGRIDCYTAQDCATTGFVPSSLAEMTVVDGNSFYDLSLVDGFNINLSFAPVGGTVDGTPYRCLKADCSYPILAECPQELQLVNAQGVVVSCQAACNVFNDDLYCCRGAHDTPETCRSSDWPVDYAGWFKERCPDAYSYAYDDLQSTYTCDSDSYIITFM